MRGFLFSRAYISIERCVVTNDSLGHIKALSFPFGNYSQKRDSISGTDFAGISLFHLIQSFSIPKRVFLSRCTGCMVTQIETKATFGNNLHFVANSLLLGIQLIFHNRMFSENNVTASKYVFKLLCIVVTILNRCFVSKEQILCVGWENVLKHKRIFMVRISGRIPSEVSLLQT